MSATIIAYTIIGSKVDRSDFFIQAEESVHGGCGEMGTGQYCPTCGKSVHAVEVTSDPVPGFEPEEGDECQGVIEGMSLHPMGDVAGCFLVVECHKVEPDFDSDPKVFHSIDMDAAREKVRAALEPIGLWEPEEFGVWTALHYGC